MSVRLILYVSHVAKTVPNTGEIVAYMSASFVCADTLRPGRLSSITDARKRSERVLVRAGL